jgi:hypothetical protein
MGIRLGRLEFTYRLRLLDHIYTRLQLLGPEAVDLGSCQSKGNAVGQPWIDQEEFGDYSEQSLDRDSYWHEHVKNILCQNKTCEAKCKVVLPCRLVR